MENKNTIRFLILIAILTLTTIMTYADYDPSYVLMCLEDGQSIPSAETPYYTCDLRMGGYCQVCARSSNLDPRGVHPYRCDEQNCHFMNGTIDEEPPVITINLPIDQSIHTSGTVTVDIGVNEVSKIERYDHHRRKWVTMCSLCPHYTRGIRFDDGEQILTIKATDTKGNSAEDEISFFVDSKSPRISKTEPKKGYADGNFIVEFKEDNPVSLLLKYGNGAMEEKEVNLGDCTEDRGKTTCTVYADLAAHDEQDIEYWFILEDIAGNIDISDPKQLKVDSTAPIINSIDYTIDGAKVYFTINVTELNIEEVGYIDLLDPRGKEKRLCSKLDGGICEKKISLKDGPHEISIYAIDEAGNKVAQSVSFFTDSKKPKISKTEPRRGLTNGNFMIQFQEANPKSLTIHYNNSLGVTGQKNVNIASDCTVERGRYTCNSWIDLSPFNTQDIQYYVELTDLLDQVAVSKKPITLTVDTSDPVINNPGSLYTIDGRYVYFNIDITEENFDEISYLDLNDPRARDRRLCSRLDEGICQAKKSFRNGIYDLRITVLDDAGNSAFEDISFTIV